MKKQLIYLLTLISVIQAVNITIYTKNFAPFSYEGKGFSIDFLNIMLTNIFGQSANITIDVLSGNTGLAEIFEKVLNHTDSMDGFSLGTSGITITEEREKYMDFLPSFFSSGFQVLTHTDNSFGDKMNAIINNFFIALAVLVAALFFFISVLAPIGWLTETMFPDDKTIPVFIDWHTREKLKGKEFIEVDLYCKKINVSTKVYMMLADFLVTLQWTTFTIFGTLTGYPNSAFTRGIHIILKGVAVLMIMVGTATFAAVFTVSSQSTAINDYAGLRDHVVCTVKGSTSEAYLDANNVGFGVYRTDSVNAMFEGFWMKQCDAVVYDFPALQDAILKREEETGSANALIVGPVFKIEFYGFATKPGNPYFETLRRGVIKLNNDHAQIETLTEKWFSKIKGVEGNDSTSIPNWVIVVPSILGISVLVVAIVWLYRNYNENDEKYNLIRRSNLDMDYTDDRIETLRLEQDTATRLLYGLDKTEDLIVAPSVIRNRRLLEELILIFNGQDPGKIGNVVQRLSTISRKRLDAIEKDENDEKSERGNERVNECEMGNMGDMV